MSDPAFKTEMVLRVLCNLVRFLSCLLLLLWDYTICYIKKKKGSKTQGDLNCPTLIWCLTQNCILLKPKRCFKDSFSSGVLQRIRVM